MLLMRQWLTATMNAYDYMTVCVDSRLGEDKLLVFQLLELERKSIIVRPFVDASDEAELQGLYVVSYQPLELWSGGAEIRPEVERLETFVLQTPAKTDILTLCGGLAGRPGICVWQARTSDVDGCVELYNRQPLIDRRVDLMTSHTPVLALTDALTDKGFVGVQQVVHHRVGVLQYDSRGLSGRRAYLPCVLRTNDLAAKGIKEFASAGCGAYFEALLGGKGAVRPGMPAAAYKRLLAGEAGDDLTVAALEVDAPLPLPGPARARARRQTAPRPPPPLADEGESSGESIVGGGQAHGTIGKGGPVDRWPAPESDNSVAGGSGLADGAACADRAAPAALVSARRLPNGAPATISACAIQFVPGRITMTHTYADRLSVRCPAHQRCTKSRPVELLRDQLGPRCAEAFLGVWIAHAGASERAAHAKYMPSVAEMREYLEAHP